MFEQTTRRRFLLTSAGGAFVLARPAIGQESLQPTPACEDNDAATLRQTEGPFFKPRSPERADLRDEGAKGQPIELVGFVLTRRCRPVERVLVDVWHADADGEYDNSGFRFRGHVFTDAEGRYRFRSIVPAVYPGRTRHFHVKVQAPSRPLLTTQLYFPGEAQNRRDPLFRRELLIKTAKAQGWLAGRFDFVLDMS